MGRGRVGDAVLALEWRGLARVMAHETGVRPLNLEVEALLGEGDAALAAGDRATAHARWRKAAAADPYDERVWLRLLRVIDDDDDRRVCLENIIGLNPLNTEARQQLRALNASAPPLSEAEKAALLPPGPRRPNTTAKPATAKPGTAASRSRSARPPQPTAALPPIRRVSFLRAFAIGLGVGLVAVALGVAASIVAHTLGLLPLFR
jgi:hypothetical protein